MRWSARYLEGAANPRSASPRHAAPAYGVQVPWVQDDEVVALELVLPKWQLDAIVTSDPPVHVTVVLPLLSEVPVATVCPEALLTVKVSAVPLRRLRCWEWALRCCSKPSYPVDRHGE